MYNKYSYIDSSYSVMYNKYSYIDSSYSVMYNKYSYVDSSYSYLPTRCQGLLLAHAHACKCVFKASLRACCYHGHSYTYLHVQSGISLGQSLCHNNYYKIIYFGVGPIFSQAFLKRD